MKKEEAEVNYLNNLTASFHVINQARNFLGTFFCDRLSAEPVSLAERQISMKDVIPCGKEGRSHPTY